MPLPGPRLALPTLRNLRWASGLTLWTYVALHLINHAAGLVSLEAAEGLRQAVHGLWRTPPGTVVLYGALAVHGAMALAAVWQRRSLRMPAVEAVRLALGLCLPLLLAAHATGTRWAQEAWGVAPSYARIVQAIWTPEGVALQLLLLTVAWAHGCLGLHLALRVRASWRRAQPLLLTGAVLLPVLAALGLLSMAREMAATGMPAPPGAGPEAGRALRGLTDGLRTGWLLALAAVLLLRHAWDRWRLWRGQGRLTLHYPGRSVQVPRGYSVLEASRAHGIPHLSRCGGRARCSTCRVRVEGPPGHLPPPQRDERLTLQRVGAPPGVRLACQLRPAGDLRVTPLFHPGGASALAAAAAEEREVAVLFVDLRRWSGLSERQWPFDLAWVLDQYFERVGSAVRDAGGLPNQFIGDSVMALFGLDTDLPTACRQALRAAALIEERMEAWATPFQAQFGHALDFGMGLHAGRVAVGRVGFEETTTFTAVGEVVNTASRLQEHSKVAGARLVLSRDAARLAGVLDRLDSPVEIPVRGRSVPLAVLPVARPAALWGTPPVSS